MLHLAVNSRKNDLIKDVLTFRKEQDESTDTVDLGNNIDINQNANQQNKILPDPECAFQV